MSTIQFCGKKLNGITVEGIFFKGDSNGQAFLPVMTLLHRGLSFSAVAALQQAGINWFPTRLSVKKFEKLTRTLAPEIKESFRLALESGGAFHKK